MQVPISYKALSSGVGTDITTYVAGAFTAQVQWHNQAVLFDVTL